MQIAHRSVRHWGALGVVAVLATACGGDPSTGNTADEPEPSAAETAAIEWLAEQPENGLVYNAAYKYQDYGLSADIALLLAETDGTTAEAIGSAVAKDAAEYAAPGFGTELSAGALAKLVLLSTYATGAEPPKVGRQDALTLLESRVTPKGPSAGRLTDLVDPKVDDAADYSNTVAQAFGVRALEGVDSERTMAATDFLLEQQCADGWFRVYFTADPAAKDQSCDADKSSKPDVDATAFAVQALAGSDHPEAEDAVGAAVRWLKGQQADDGSFASGRPVVPNSNSTGLAGDVLGGAGEDDAAAAAATWVAEHQIACGPDAGAIAYDDDALRSGKVTPKSEGVFQLATVQAVEVLDELPTNFEQKEC